MDPELDELRREFLAEAEEKVSELEVKVHDRSPESLERLTYLAHQLKGSGGSYGFQNISDDAEQLENAVEQLAADGNEQAAARIELHIGNLRKEIDLRMRELAVV